MQRLPLVRSQPGSLTGALGGSGPTVNKNHLVSGDAQASSGQFAVSFDLAIYRFGALAELTNGSNATLRRPVRTELEASFRELTKYIQIDKRYWEAKRAIEDAAKEITGDRVELLPIKDESDEDAFVSVLNMPPSVELPSAEELESSQLVALLPSEQFDVKLGGTEWALRVRASVSACALETEHGLPKLWWTFEGIPKDPDPDHRPTEDETVSFLSFVRKMDTGDKKNSVLNLLGDAYFDALAKVTQTPKQLSYSLGEERIRIRYADNNDVEYAALIEALRFRGLTASQIEDAKGDSLKVAKRGLHDFEKFVLETNAPKDQIDPRTADVEKDVRLPGVDAVSARCDCPETSSVSIAGIAQRPGSRTPYDHLTMVRQQRIAENRDTRIRARSAARQLSGHLAGVETLKLELKRRKRELGNKPVRVAPAPPAFRPH